MAAGTPVVATPNPGAEEVLDHGKYGFIVPEARLGEALCALLTREEMRQDYSKRGSDRATMYSWDRVAERYEKVHEAVLQREKGSA
jgi:glycosyltransferase involved in cell wall biosynthesis